MSSDPYSQDNVVTKLRAMKLQYARERVYANPVSLLAHFEEFEAYTTILESHYAQQRDSEEKKSTEIAKEEWQKKKDHDDTVDKPSERITQGEVDKNVEYRMREIKSNLKMLETECKSCRSHVNAMQSILKQYGDEAKSIR